MFTIATIGFGLTTILLKKLKTKGRQRIIIVAGTITILMQLLSPIGMSTDLYRYIWQGRVSNAGLNNYELTPDSVKLTNPQINKDLYSRQDWREVKSIYPPVAEKYFQAQAAIFDAPFLENESFHLRLAASKLPNLLFYIVVGLFLVQLSSGTVASIWALSPFIQFELLNSAHIELVMAAFVAATLIALKRKQLKYHLFAGASLGMAISVKLTPILLFVPLFAISTSKSLRHSILFIVGVAAAVFTIVPTLLADNFELLKHISDWSGGRYFSFGNPIFESISYIIPSETTATLLRGLFLIVITLLTYRIYKEVKDGIVDTKKAYNYLLMVSLTPAIASPILLQWYWVIPTMIMALNLPSLESRESKDKAFIYLLAIHIFLAVGYIDRADDISSEIKKFIILTSMTTVYLLVFRVICIITQKPQTKAV